LPNFDDQLLAEPTNLPSRENRTTHQIAFLGAALTFFLKLCARHKLPEVFKIDAVNSAVLRAATARIY